MTSAPFAAIETAPRMRRSAIIAQKIRDMLMDGQLKPGHRLPTEEKLGQLFQVSRTTLREAIQMLRVSGLLDVTPGRGSFVRMPDLSRAMDDLALYGVCKGNPEVDQIRLSFQRDMLENVANQTEEARKKLYDSMVSRYATAEENATLEENWHLTLAELGGGEMAKLMLGALLKMQQKQRIEKFSSSDEVMRTISVQMRLNNALTDGDAELAKRIITAYLGNGNQKNSAHIQKAA